MRYNRIQRSCEKSRPGGAPAAGGRAAGGLFANPYYDVWGGPGKPPLPVYPVTLRSVLTGILPFGQRHQFLQAARRAVGSDADLRWGVDRKGFRRLLHPSGVCLFGRWQTTEPSEYTGYFRQGSEALIVGRWSSCCTETRRGRTRSLSMVGKLWPTTDPDHRPRCCRRPGARGGGGGAGRLSRYRSTISMRSMVRKQKSPESSRCSCVRGLRIPV